MELENEKDADIDKESKKPTEAPKNLNMNHEDLSDVSDLDDSIGSHSDEEALEKQASELRQKIEEIRKPESDVQRLSEKVKFCFSYGKNDFQCFYHLFYPKD